MTSTRVHKIEIIYPEGCREPGWHPAVWTDPEYLATCTREQRREIRRLLRKPFRWPRERLFLSSSGAYHRAGLLRFYGAQARVAASDPVTWPSDWELSGDAAEWYPELDEAAEIQETQDWARANATMYQAPAPDDWEHYFESEAADVQDR